MGRTPCCDKTRVKRGPWSPEEDETLKNYLHNHGTAGNWITLPQRAGLKRCGKSCRLRWLNYLRPNIKHGAFTTEEDNIICTLYAKMGSRWSIIASHLPGRTDNDVKNHWNTKLKKLMAAKINPTSNLIMNNIEKNAKTASSFNYSPTFSALLTQTLPTMAPFLADDHLAASSIAMVHHPINIPFAGVTEGSSKFYSSSQPPKDSAISESPSFTKNVNNSLAWSDNGGSSQIEEFSMDMGNGYSKEITSSGIWPQEPAVLEDLLPTSHANLFSFYYC